MENVEIAGILREVADLLEIQGANRFRVRAYRNAARTVEELTQPLTELVREGADLTEIPTIGTDIAGYITELVRTGHLRLLDEIRKDTPATLAELMKLEGVGPKKATRFYEELGIESVADLERAIDKGELQKLRGFGDRSVAKLRQAIIDYKKHITRFKLSDADQLVRPLVAYLGQAPGIEKVEVAGSYRRRRETIGDVDILAVCDDPKPVMKYFTEYPGTARVETAGPTRGTIVLHSGLHVDLRIVSGESYGAALHYFTGSKSHNIAVRALGVERGLRINEYGIFRVRGGDTGKKGKTSGQRIGGAEESEVFDAVGMAWVPPELRENRGEIQAALERKLPKLIALDDIRGDLQMHTDWSDGRNTVEEMIRACRDLGYEYLAITDHSKAVAVAGGMAGRDLERQWKEIDRLRKRFKDIHVFKGMEVDILRDGSLDLPDDLLFRLEVVVAAIHSSMGMGKTKMTDRVIKAITHPAVHILAHPTGRIINKREPFAIDLEAVLEAAAELGVAVELNAQPDRLDLDDVQVQRARELGTMVVINTDAHTTDSLHFMRYGVDQARRGWLEKSNILNCMSLTALKTWLGKRR